MGIGRLVIAGLGLLATPLFTRVLSAEEYGVFSLFVAVSALAAMVPTQWLSAAVLRYGPLTSHLGLKSMIVKGVILSLPFTVVIAITLSIFTLTSPTVIGIAALYSISEGCFNVLLVAARAHLRVWAFVAGGVLRNGTGIVVIVLLTFTSIDIGVTQISLAMLAGSILGGLAISQISARRSRMSPNACDPSLSIWWKYGSPLILNYALGMGFIYVNRFILLAISGEREVGRFSPTYDLMYAITTLIVGLIGLTTVPRIFALPQGTERLALVRKLHRRVASTAIITVIGLACVWPWLSTWLMGPQVRIGDPFVILPLLAAFGLLSYRFQYLNIRLQLAEKTMVVTAATAVTLGVNIAANFLLIPKYGLMGAALATLAGAITAVLACIRPIRTDSERVGT